MFTNKWRSIALLLLLFVIPQSHAGDAYLGLRAGILLTWAGTYPFNAALVVLGGYQLPGCCWALEADLYGSQQGGGWQGEGLAFSAVYRFGRIGQDKRIFSPKFKLGTVQTRYTLSGNTQTTTDLNWGVGLVIGAAGAYI